jgi:hypothetical protein
MAGRLRLPGGAPRKASQRNTGSVISVVAARSDGQRQPRLAERPA